MAKPERQETIKVMEEHCAFGEIHAAEMRQACDAFLRSRGKLMTQEQMRAGFFRKSGWRKHVARERVETAVTELGAEVKALAQG